MLAPDSKPLEEETRSRMSDEVAIAASSFKQGVMLLLIHILKLPDLQVPSICVRGFLKSRDLSNPRMYIPE